MEGKAGEGVESEYSRVSVLPALDQLIGRGMRREVDQYV